MAENCRDEEAADLSLEIKRRKLDGDDSALGSGHFVPSTSRENTRHLQPFVYSMASLARAFGGQVEALHTLERLETITRARIDVLVSKEGDVRSTEDDLASHVLLRIGCMLADGLPACDCGADGCGGQCSIDGRGLSAAASSNTLSDATAIHKGPSSSTLTSSTDGPRAQLSKHQPERVLQGHVGDLCRSLSRNEAQLFAARLTQCHDKRMLSCIAEELFPSLDYSIPQSGGQPAGARPHVGLADEWLRLVNGSEHVSTRLQFQIPFELAPSLVRSRHRDVRLIHGQCHLDASLLLSLAEDRFRHLIIADMERVRRLLPTMLDGEETRLVPLCRTLAAVWAQGETHGCSDRGPAVQLAAASFDLTASNIDEAAATFFPPCMTRVHRRLREQHHVKHQDRFQYTLFLKGCGMRVAENVKFWLQEFRKSMSAAEIEKKRYKYNIRHLYGLEGSRVDREPLGCDKIVLDYDCPFRSLPAPELDVWLSGTEHCLSAAQRRDVVQLAAGGSTTTCKQACERLWYYKHYSHRHPEPVSINLETPNEYFHYAVGARQNTSPDEDA